MNLPKEVVTYISATQILIDQITDLIEQEVIDTSTELEKSLDRCGTLYHKMLQKHIDDSKK